MRLVIDLIRGKKAQEALTILKFLPQSASADAELLLKSALGNLNHKATDAGTNINDNDVFVKECFVNQGPTAKRISPAPMGRAYRIRKRSNHLTIVVQTKDHSVETESN
jgi:large subunit ribosomal protein L22